MEGQEFPYLPVSPWWDAPNDLQPELSGGQKCDVAIIGGGYTGLSTAIALREEGIDVILLEQDVCGSGSSGRNAGHLTPTIGKDMPSLLKVFGKDKAGKLICFAEDAVHFTESFIQRNEIDCHYHDGGNIMAAVHSSQEKALRKSAGIAMELGGDVEYLEHSQMQSRNIPDSFLSGTLDRAGGVLHPGKLVLGLRRLALDCGVRIFEKSKVQQISDGHTVKVFCENGTVNANQLVLATNAYTPSLMLAKNNIRRKAAPVIVTLLETEALSDQQRMDVGWPGREGIYTAHEILESYHLTSRNTIVAGSKQLLIPYGSKLKTTNQPGLFQKTTVAFRDRFPQLKETKIKSYWGGYIAMSIDFLPLLGATGKFNNIHYGMAYAGHGVAQAIYMGAALKSAVLGLEHNGSEVLDRRTFNWPPEPLRWTGGQLIRGILTLMDKRVDQKIRKLRKQ